MAASFNWASEIDFLALLGPADRERLLRGARRVTRRAGVVTEYPVDRVNADIVDRGLIRAFQVTDDGREATIGYLHPREYAGVLPSIGLRPVVYLQALTDTDLLRLDTEVVASLFETNLEVTRAIATHTASVLARVVRVVTVRTLGSVDQRLAFDVLERACEEQLRSGHLAFSVTQEQLASSIGSAREVVSRALGEFRSQGIISSSRGRIRIEDAGRLARVVAGLVT